MWRMPIWLTFFYRADETTKRLLTVRKRFVSGHVILTRRIILASRYGIASNQSRPWRTMRKRSRLIRTISTPRRISPGYWRRMQIPLFAMVLGQSD